MKKLFTMTALALSLVSFSAPAFACDGACHKKDGKACAESCTSCKKHGGDVASCMKDGKGDACSCSGHKHDGKKVDDKKVETPDKKS